MSFLTKVQHGARSLDVRHGHGFFSHATETAEVLGTAYLAGRLNTQYGDKLKWKGHDMTYVGGLVLKIGAVLADILGWRVPGLHHVNSVAMGALAAHVTAMGAEHGHAKMPLPLPAPKASLGAIPPAPGPGKWLDMSQVSQLANMHG